MSWMKPGMTSFMVISRHPDLEPRITAKAEFQALNFRIKQSELDYLNINSSNKVKVSGGDYVAVFGVYHHIHCLNNIRRMINWDYYGPKLSGPEYEDAFSIGHSSM